MLTLTHVYKETKAYCENSYFTCTVVSLCKASVTSWWRTPIDPKDYIPSPQDYISALRCKRRRLDNSEEGLEAALRVHKVRLASSNEPGWCMSYLDNEGIPRSTWVTNEQSIKEYYTLHDPQ
jgi:hypothetical protein